MFETITRDLLLERTDHTLELYEGSGSNWRLVKTGTPGNLGSFEDILFANNEMRDTPAIVALVTNFRDNECTVGLAYVDLTKRMFGLTEFLDDNHFTNSESALVALGCKECLIPAEITKSCEYRALQEVMTRCGVMVTERKKSEFKGRDVVQDLGRLVKGTKEPIQDLVSGFELAPGALGSILSYAELLADESNYENYTIRRYNLDSYMKLDSAAMKALNVLESKCGVMVTERKKSEFKGRDVVQDLGRLVKGTKEPIQDLVSGFELAPGALGSILSYAELLADESNYENYTIRRYNLDSYMKLDSAAMKALNVLESKSDANKNFSLFGLMNRTCTAGMGKRMLHMWLKQPLLDAQEINCRLDLVQAFVEDAELRQDLRQHLKRISDIERLVHNFHKKRASLVHIVKLYQSSIRLPYIKGALERYNGQFASLIKEKYLDHLEYWCDERHINRFIALVETSIDLDQLENGEYMISPSYDSSLSSLKNEKETIEREIRALHEKTSSDLDLVVDKALKLDRGPQFGHFFRITQKEEQKVRKKLNTHFIILDTRKDGVKFTNTKLKKLGDQYQMIVEEYKNCQKELVVRVVKTASTFSEVFEGIAVLLSELDVLLSFADLAANCSTPYTRPDITPPDVGDIILEGCRHPCVEAQDWVNFIPNDCKLVRGKSWFQIITGPNMGGKSTFIRQVGVNILMAQVGSFIPCDKASISIRDCIFARIGAGDCQLRGVSTFMQEMLETASILKGATDKSLIIIDELGRGTSTYDGFGLAWAICEHIVEAIKAPTLFATHFHELTALANENMHDDQSKYSAGIVNCHVSAHIDSKNRKLTMLYKVEPGACDQSFGIHVAEFANFPESVVSLAREKAAELEDFSPTSILFSDAEATSKRKREFDSDDVSRGAARARQFLKDFTELPLDKIAGDKSQVLQLLKELKTKLEKDAGDYPWLQQFLQ
ncbi:unnamed protein product [Cuscuta campestris]|uniref:DNA mismatch repair protein MSH2 n=1 Tax=Cuscuta campestris TaxID=132261 RepID=A0A484LQZ3_9ASTE|nr:unnamed protein product [Cuscuta campestris]